MSLFLGSIFREVKFFHAYQNLAIPLYLCIDHFVMQPVLLIMSQQFWQSLNYFHKVFNNWAMPHSNGKCLHQYLGVSSHYAIELCILRSVVQFLEVNIYIKFKMLFMADLTCLGILINRI